MYYYFQKETFFSILTWQPIEIAWKKSCWGQIKNLLKIIALVALFKDACPLERFLNSQKEHLLQHFEMAIQKYSLDYLFSKDASLLECFINSKKINIFSLF